jgi:hypothetical protein
MTLPVIVESSAYEVLRQKAGAEIAVPGCIFMPALQAWESRVLTLAFWPVTRYTVTRYRWRSPMAAAAERMKMMRQRRRARGLRELRLVVADPRSRAVRRRVAKQVAGLDLDRERDALNWIESVSEFDADATR